MGAICSTEANVYPCVEGTEDPQAVILHIYSLGNSASADVANKLLRKFGTGAFHCGVEVYGSEYSFSTQIWSSRLGKGSGVFRVPPRRAVGHRYMESLVLGVTVYPDHAVSEMLKELAEEWPAAKYDTLRRNCHHFCSTLCELLGVDPLPKWITSLPEAGESIVYPAACCHGDLSPPRSESLYHTVTDEGVNLTKAVVPTRSPRAESVSTATTFRGSPSPSPSGRFSTSQRTSSSSEPFGERLLADMHESFSDSGTTTGEVIVSSKSSEADRSF